MVHLEFLVLYTFHWYQCQSRRTWIKERGPKTGDFTIWCSNRSVGYLNRLLCLLFVFPPCLTIPMHLHGGSPNLGTDSNEIHAKQVIMGYFGYFSKVLVGTPWETPVHPQDGSQLTAVISKQFCTFYNKTSRHPDSPDSTHLQIVKITASNQLDIVSTISWMCLRSLELVNHELLPVTIIPLKPM